MSYQSEVKIEVKLEEPVELELTPEQVRVRQSALRQFQTLREFSDELPPYDLSPEHEGYDRYKCRNAVFVTVVWALHGLLNRAGLTDGILIEKAKGFIFHVMHVKKHREGHPLGRGFTIEEDIRCINEILDLFIEELGK